MGTPFQVVFDCANATKLAEFWASALNYKIQEPPPGFSNWEEWAAKMGIPQEQWDKWSSIVDPEGRWPRIFFQGVPEGKVVKNRVHLDINCGGRDVPEEERRKRISDEVQRLVGLGATKLKEMEEMGSYWIVMQDPEGNEFCLQ